MCALEWANGNHGIRVGRANSARAFVDALRRSNDTWWENGRMPWAFRGHASKGWSLTPSVWRSDNQIFPTARDEAQRRFDLAKPNQELCWFFGNFRTGIASFGVREQELGRRLVIETTAELLPVYDFLPCMQRRRAQYPIGQSAS